MTRMRMSPHSWPILNKRGCMEEEIEELAERGLGYFLEPNTSLKTNLKKVILEAYKAGMEATAKIYKS